MFYSPGGVQLLQIPFQSSQRLMQSGTLRRQFGGAGVPGFCLCWQQLPRGVERPQPIFRCRNYRYGIYNR